MKTAADPLERAGRAATKCGEGYEPWVVTEIFRGNDSGFQIVNKRHFLVPDDVCQIDTTHIFVRRQIKRIPIDEEG